MTDDTAAITALGQTILDATAGQRTEIAHKAMADALASSVGAIGFASGLTVQTTQGYLQGLCDAMLMHVAMNWGNIEHQKVN